MEPELIVPLDLIEEAGDSVRMKKITTTRHGRRIIPPARYRQNDVYANGEQFV